MGSERENLVSRRDAFKPIAAAALASAAVIPAVATAAENPDAALLDLVRRCNEAMDASDAHHVIYNAAEDRYSRPPLPEAIYARATDPFPAYIGRPEWQPGDVGEPQGRLCFENTAAIKYLKTVRRSAKPDVRARIDEILAAEAAWHDQADANWKAAGLDTATQKERRLSGIAHELRHEICAMPARTLPGLLAKAAIVARCFGEEETFADYCADELERTGTASGEAVARSIACDLVAMLPGGSNA
jgi:hypothetical protein